MPVRLNLTYFSDTPPKERDKKRRATALRSKLAQTATGHEPGLSARSARDRCCLVLPRNALSLWVGSSTTAPQGCAGGADRPRAGRTATGLPERPEEAGRAREEPSTTGWSGQAGRGQRAGQPGDKSPNFSRPGTPPVLPAAPQRASPRTPTPARPRYSRRSAAAMLPSRPAGRFRFRQVGRRAARPRRAPPAGVEETTRLPARQRRAKRRGGQTGRRLLAGRTRLRGGRKGRAARCAQPSRSAQSSVKQPRAKAAARLPDSPRPSHQDRHHCHHLRARAEAHSWARRPHSEAEGNTYCLRAGLELWEGRTHGHTGPTAQCRAHLSSHHRTSLSSAPLWGDARAAHAHPEPRPSRTPPRAPRRRTGSPRRLGRGAARWGCAMADCSLRPHVHWAQRHRELYLRVELSDVKVPVSVPGGGDGAGRGLRCGVWQRDGGPPRAAAELPVMRSLTELVPLQNPDVSIADNVLRFRGRAAAAAGRVLSHRQSVAPRIYMWGTFPRPSVCLRRAHKAPLCPLSQPHLEGKAAPSVKALLARPGSTLCSLPSVRIGHFFGRFFPSIPVNAASSASPQRAPGRARPRVSAAISWRCARLERKLGTAPRAAPSRAFPAGFHRARAACGDPQQRPAELWHRWFLQLHASGVSPLGSLPAWDIPWFPDLPSQRGRGRHCKNDTEYFFVSDVLQRCVGLIRHFVLIICSCSFSSGSWCQRRQHLRVSDWVPRTGRA